MAEDDARIHAQPVTAPARHSCRRRRSWSEGDGWVARAGHSCRALGELAGARGVVAGEAIFDISARERGRLGVWSSEMRGRRAAVLGLK